MNRSEKLISNISEVRYANWKYKNFEMWKKELLTLEKKHKVIKNNPHVKDQIADIELLEIYYSQFNTPCDALAVMINDWDIDTSFCE